MPFAQKRFCTAENITNMQTLSDVHNQSFGKNYGVLIEGLPVPLLARAIFVVDKNNKITYAEIRPRSDARTRTTTRRSRRCKAAAGLIDRADRDFV